MKSRISKVALNTPPSGIRVMFNMALGVEGLINLAAGEPNFKTPENIIEAGYRAMKEGFTHYTSNKGAPELREAISEKLFRENSISYDPHKEVTVTVGAMNGLYLGLKSILDGGDEVIIPEPAWPNYLSQVLMCGGVPVTLPLRHETSFEIVPEELENLITKKTKAIFVNTPSNPTGAVVGRNALKGIAELAIEHDLFVISDEPYEKLIYEGEHLSIASLDDMQERTLTINSFSKSYAMTGWRLGYVAGPSDVVSQMSKLQEHVNSCPTSISQMAGVEALKGSQDAVAKMKEKYRERRDMLYEGLKKIDGISMIKPKGAFYAFPQISDTGKKSEELAELLLKEGKVVTVPGTTFGRVGEGFLRLSFASSTSELKEALLRLEMVLEKEIDQ